MIVPMKKILLLVLEQDRESALQALRELGVMHIAGEVVSDSADRRLLEARCLALHRVLEQLAQRAQAGKEAAKLPVPQGKPEELFERARSLFGEVESLQREREQWLRRREKLAPWGDFSTELLTELAGKGVFVTLCEAPENQFRTLLPTLDKAVVKVVREGSPTLFAVISDRESEAHSLPVSDADFSTSLADLDRKISSLDETLRDRGRQLTELAGALPLLRKQLAEWESDREYAVVRDTLGEHGVVVSLTGFVPERDVPALETAAGAHAWAVFLSTPGPDDRVPTLLDMPKWARVVKPLFEFLSITPGYHEYDVSGAVLVFFTIFFGMIVGDAGYGLIFLGGTLWGMHKLRGRPETRTPMLLLVLLSSAAIVWGGLNGNIFGLPGIPGLPALTTSPHKNANVEAVCFVLALAQLSLGRFWQALTARSWRKVVAQTGWVVMLVANFLLVIRLLVYPGDFPACLPYLYGAGVVMIAVGEIDVRDIGSIFSFPFGLTGSFVDVLSYIRLFAVGMAGYYIAMSFNDMARMLMDSSVWLIPAGVLVAVFGHTLNIALAAMSVLVHGVRLNTLEFSNHIGMGWTGIEFKPFQKTQSK